MGQLELGPEDPSHVLSLLLPAFLLYLYSSLFLINCKGYFKINILL
jgi:hypothetical protein